MIALLRLKPVAPLCSRDASVIRTETRALIRIANETERALSAAAELNDRSVSVGGDLLLFCLEGFLLGLLLLQ